MWMGNEIVAEKNADDNLNVGARYFVIRGFGIENVVRAFKRLEKSG